MAYTIEGLPLSVADAAGAHALQRALESYLGSRSDTPLILKEAMTRDPDHLMARCMMGYLLKLAGDPANAERARALHRELCGRVESGAGNAWERGHVEALGLWLGDELAALEDRLEALVDDYPTDVLSLRMLHYLYFYDGAARRMRDSVAARLPAYRGHALEGYVKGMYAFGLEEAGDYALAERIGREAVEINHRDLWATHAVAHVMQMQARPAEGVDWLQSLRPNWGDGNNFRYHLYWHEALFHLSRRDLERALAIYDGEVGPAVEEDFYLDMCNAASLLLRLEALGHDVGDRWQPLARVAQRHVADTELVFASLHYLMPLVKVGSEAAGELLETLRHWAAADTSQGRLMREVALDVSEFLVAVGAGDVSRALGLFEGFRDELHRIGGSHAQRELFGVMAADAADGSPAEDESR